MQRTPLASLLVTALLAGCVTADDGSVHSTDESDAYVQLGDTDESDPYVQLGDTDKMIRASDCIGAVVNGKCHGQTIDGQWNNKTCHGTILNGECIGAEF